jgi:ribosomal peptide maturation radical SAM protein 1
MAQLFRSEAKSNRELRRTDFSHLTSRVKSVSEEWLAATDWTAVRLVGVSCVLCQLTASLYIIHRLKERWPHLAIVVGGAAFNQESGPAALELFPDIDAVVYGEGELPLAHLVHDYVLEGRPIAEMTTADGLIIRDSGAPPQTGGEFNQLADLDSLPTPDFDDYFEMLSGFDPDKRFFPTLPIEFSRGCWWRCETDGTESRGCAFCNLNLQWRGYRSKSAARAVSEVEYLTRRHRVLSLAIMDNVLPKHAFADILRMVSALKRDFSIFGEIRATTPLAELKLMRAAGMSKVQVGIEALSTRLLRKLRKGTTAIQNLEIMKHCEAVGIACLSNLIADFPTSDEEDIRETLWTMEFAGWFRPPKLVSFWLGLGSPVWRRPDAYGIRKIMNHRNWSRIFPPQVLRQLPLIVQGYRGEMRQQRRLWKPVRDRLKAWIRVYDDLHRGSLTEPILSYRDGGDFLIIRERRPNGNTTTHRLEGASRQIYRFCERHRPLRHILASFPNIPAESITSFLRMMNAGKLMFAENDHYLSLAVPFNCCAEDKNSER